jgi:CubicO group peptidase (beta-lactamase class C family)
VVAALALASALILAVASRAADPPAAPAAAAAITRERIDAALPEFEKRASAALASNGVPGMSIAIMFRDQVVYAAGFGVREAGKGLRVDADTGFQPASVTTQVAALPTRCAVSC